MFSLLSDEQKQLGRRAFLQAASTLPAVKVMAQTQPPEQKVRAGIIGSGSQGQVLLEQGNRKYMDIRAVCDIRPSNRQRGLQLAQSRFNPKAQAYLDYLDLLARDDLDAVLIATPLWMHAPMVKAALQAGKHVFCEKALALSLDEAVELMRLAKQTGLNLQVGHQRFYNPIYHQAYRMILEGLIGEIYHVRALWHRNNDWRRSPPQEDVQAVERGALNPQAYGYDDLEHLVNWRLYQKHSGGLPAELMSHQISIINWIVGTLPNRVAAVADIYRYTQGSREVPDHIYCTFEYPTRQVVTYSAIQSNDFEGFYEMFMGTQGTLIVSREVDSYLFWNPEAVEKQEVSPTKVGVTKDKVNQGDLKASASRAKDAAQAAHAGGADEGGFGVLVPYQTELEGFANTLLFQAPNLCDAEIGMEAAACCLLANEAAETGEAVPIAERIELARHS